MVECLVANENVVSPNLTVCSRKLIFMKKATENFQKEIEFLKNLSIELNELRVDAIKDETSEDVKMEIETFNATKEEAKELAASLSSVLNSLKISIKYIIEKDNLLIDGYLDIEEVNDFLIKETKNNTENDGWKWHLEGDVSRSFPHYYVSNKLMPRENIYYVELKHAGFYKTFYFEIDSPVGKNMVAIEGPGGKIYKIKGRW